MDVNAKVLKGMIEFIASTFTSEYNNHHMSTYVIDANGYYSALFTNRQSGEITIHSINKGTYIDGTNLLSKEINVYVNRDNMSMGAYSSRFIVTGDLTFEFESCMR